MRINIKIPLLFIMTSSFLFSLQWPVEKPVLAASFGSPRESELEVGVFLESAVNHVKPYKPGELIFWASEKYGPGEMDGVIILLHEDGFRSCYGRIIPHINMENRSYFKEEDLLGVKGKTLLFSIRDNPMKLWVNPLFMFTSLNDDIKPDIEGIFLESEKGRIELSGQRQIPPQNYRLLIKTSDRMTKDGSPLVPHQIKVRYLGRVVYSLSLDSLVSRGGVIEFKDSSQRGSPFTEEGLIDAGLLGIIGGKGFLEVEVTDYRGNKTTRSYPVNQESP